MLPKIVKAPASVLSTPTQTIENVDGSIVKLSKTMGLVLRASGHGVALAANQIGYSKSMFVYLDENKKLQTVINTEIVIDSPDLVTDNEGCLSIPGKNFRVPRPKMVSVKFVDLSGESRYLLVEDFMARMFKHEMDHLSGKLLTDGHISD